MFISSYRDVGGPGLPQEIRRLRRQNLEMCRKFGQPVIFRHMFNLDDVEQGLAIKCPVCYDGAYEQTRHNCLACYGVGYVSSALHPTLYYTTDGNATSTNTGIHASRFGGFDKPYLTWLMEPDVAVDVFKINEQGVMIQTYDAQGVAPWSPKLGDNDLCINVILDPALQIITQELTRFQLKMTQQITMRGFGRKAESLAQPYLVAQSFQMAHVPEKGSGLLSTVPADVAATYFA